MEGCPYADILRSLAGEITPSIPGDFKGARQITHSSARPGEDVAWGELKSAPTGDVKGAGVSPFPRTLSPAANGMEDRIVFPLRGLLQRDDFPPMEPQASSLPTMASTTAESEKSSPTCVCRTRR